MAHLITKVAEYGLVFKESKVLVLRFSKKTNPGEKWIFPGGRVDEGEIPKTGLLREIDEEVGLKVQIDYPCDVSMWGIGEDHRYAVFFICDWKEGEVRLSHEHQDYRWISEEDINSIEYHDSSFATILKKAFFLKKKLE